MYNMTDACTCIQTVVSMTGGTYFVAFRIYKSLLNGSIYSAMLVAYCKTGNVSTPLNIAKLALRF